MGSFDGDRKEFRKVGSDCPGWVSCLLGPGCAEVGKTQGLCCGVGDHHGQSEKHGCGGKTKAHGGGPNAKLKGHSPSMGQRPAALGQLPASCLKRGKPATKGKDWESGVPRQGSSRQRVKAKQDAWEKGRGRHGWLDLRIWGRGRFMDEAKDTSLCSQLPVKQP